MAWSPISRRQFMTIYFMAEAGIFGASEAVSSVAIEHPEWDMDEMKTWPEWEEEYLLKKKSPKA